MSDRSDNAWFAVQTRPGREADAERELKRKGFAVWYWWCMRETCVGPRHRRRTCRIKRAYFPCYVFVGASERVSAINQTAFVSGILYAGDRPLHIDAEELGSIALNVGVDENGFVLTNQAAPEDEVRVGDVWRLRDLPPLYAQNITVVDMTSLDKTGQITATMRAFGANREIVVPLWMLGEIVDKAPERSVGADEPHASARQAPPARRAKLDRSA